MRMSQNHLLSQICKICNVCFKLIVTVNTLVETGIRRRPDFCWNWGTCVLSGWLSGVSDSATCTTVSSSSLEPQYGSCTTLRMNTSSRRAWWPNGRVVILSFKINRLSSYPESDFLLHTTVISRCLLEAILVLISRTVSPPVRTCLYNSCVIMRLASCVTPFADCFARPKIEVRAF